MEFASREILEGTYPPTPIMDAVPRPEYPRPQFARADWRCLNGIWDFEIDRTNDGEIRRLDRAELSGEILVPFVAESELSGIGDTSFLEAVWYHREAQIPADWNGRRVLLHFQAVDHDTTVWVNGNQVGSHRGGFTPFTFDITDVLTGEVEGMDRSAVIVVRARDSSTDVQARGKQSQNAGNYEAFYTRSTGIWQTVWLEPVDRTHLERPRITPNLRSGSLRFELPVSGATGDTAVEVIVTDQYGEIVRASAQVGFSFQGELTVVIPEQRRVAWSPKHPHLYDIEFVVRRGTEVVDRVSSYAGLRSVEIDGKRVLINGEPLFQRLVLDQGYYPDGLMTAPSEAALIADIELSMSAGFNGARLHQKVFEERFLYHADRLGYLVWGEFGDWGARVDKRQQPTASFITQWIEAVNRDYSHPSIIGWCPLNETFEPLGENITVLDDVTIGMFLATKALDKTRPVVDASGYAHRVANTDIYDSHTYEQDPEKFAELMSGLAINEPYISIAEDGTQWSLPYAGQPYFCSEFGGIWWSQLESSGGDSWGYGDAPRSIEEWYERAEGLFAVLLDDPNMFGYCFTQLTDVFQEQNGIFSFDREPKFDLGRIRSFQGRSAAYEIVEHPPSTEDLDERPA